MKPFSQKRFYQIKKFYKKMTYKVTFAKEILSTSYYHLSKIPLFRDFLFDLASHGLAVSTAVSCIYQEGTLG